MSYKLENYTEKQKADFIVEYNHNKGLKIEDIDGILYALEANEIMGVNEEGLKVPMIDPDYETKQAQAERERIAMLSLTAADVERAIYKTKGIDFEDILTLVEAQPVSEDTPAIDIKALKIELKANNFYRGNPYIEQVGALLGLTSQQLDEFFMTNDYTKLLTLEIAEEVNEENPEGEEVTEDNGTGQASDTSSNSPVIENEGVEDEETA